MMGLLAILAVLLAGCAALVSLCTYLFFVYEAVNTGHLGMLRARPGPGPARLLPRALGTSLASQILACLLYPMGLFAGRIFPGPERGPVLDGELPVILIHGLYHNASAWLVFRSRLRRAGYGRIFARSYNSWTNDFPTLLDRLCGQVEEVHAALGVKPVLVGHSLGGLLARACASDPRCRDRIAAVAALGAPHQGSRLAALAWGRLGRGLLFDGELIRSIRAADQPPTFPCLSLYTVADNFVLPPQAARFQAPGWLERETPPVSHVSLLFDGPTAAMVIGFLDAVRQGGTDGQEAAAP